MKLKVYTSNDFYKAICKSCSWIQEKSYKDLPKSTGCPNCSTPRITHFPSTQSAHILGGMIHFIDSYNQKIQGEKHIFPPQVYLPIIFACSNYETLLSDLVGEIIKCYGSYIGRLGRFIVFDEVLSSYDKRTNEKLFKALTLESVQQAVQKEYPHYFQEFQNISKVRNNVVHGHKLDNTAAALSVPNQAIDFLLKSIEVFRYLNNHYVAKFEENVDFRKVLRLADDQDFEP